MSDGAAGVVSGGASSLRRMLAAVQLALPLLLFGAFVGLAAAKVAAFGLCCADDGYFASVAKNVAVGPGYGTTTSGEGFRPFDPEIGTGPALILPAAAATALLGNRYWVPGAVAVALWSLLLLGVHLGLRGRAGVRNLALASCVFLLGVTVLFPFHLEQWHALLGEVPAALLVLLGLVVFARSELSARTVALASFLCALAFLTKLVSALYAAAAFLALLVRVLGERRGARELLRLCAVWAAAFAAPVLAFEIYKVVALGGLAGWRQNLAETSAFVRVQGAPASPRGLARWTRALEYDRAVAARFGVSVWQLVAAAIAVAIGLLRRGGPVHRRLALPLVTGILASAAWYLLRSMGRPRHLVVTIVLAWALVALALTAVRARWAAAAAAALLAALLAVNREKLPVIARGLEHGPFAKAPELESALALAGFVDARRGEIPFANQWWATTADLEYYSRSTDVFRRYSLVPRERPYYVVFNRAFRYDADAEFTRLLATCAPAERSFEPYAVLACGR